MSKNTQNSTIYIFYHQNKFQHTKPTFIDLFSIYIFTVSNMNRIMKDPIMKIIPFTWPVLENHHGVIMVYTYVQQKNVTSGMVD